jgi:hypothetical protein
MAEELSRPPKEKTGNFDLRFVRILVWPQM